MPKSKEQKRKEAKERELYGKMLDLIRGVYSNTPYGSNYFYSQEYAVNVEGLGQFNFQTAYRDCHQELIKAHDALSVSRELHDYAYAGIGVFSGGRFDFRDVVELFSNEKMIVWAATFPVNFISSPAVGNGSLKDITEKTTEFFNEYWRWARLTGSTKGRK